MHSKRTPDDLFHIIEFKAACICRSRIYLLLKIVADYEEAFI